MEFWPISTAMNGTRKIQIRVKGQNAKTIRLGRIDMDKARALKLRIEMFHNAAVTKVEIDAERLVGLPAFKTSFTISWCALA